MAAGGGGGLRADATTLHVLLFRAFPVLQGSPAVWEGLWLRTPAECQTQRDTLTTAVS